MKGYVTYIKEGQKMYYDSCLNEDCKRKVIQIENGQWRCEICHMNYNDSKARLIFNLRITDETTKIYATIYDD